MARSLQASGTNSLGPNLTFRAEEVSSGGQIRIVIREDTDTVTLLFDNREQGLEWARDLALALNALGGARR